MDKIKVNHMEKEFCTEISAEAISVSESWISDEEIHLLLLQCIHLQTNFLRDLQWYEGAFENTHSKSQSAEI